MKITILTSLFFVLTLFSCKKSEVVKTKLYNCSIDINPKNIDSFFVEDSYDNFIGLSLDFDNVNYKGKIKNIEERVYETSIKFDESHEELIEKNVYYFDSFNNIIKKTSQKYKDGPNLEVTVFKYKFEYSQKNERIASEKFINLEDVDFDYNSKAKFFYADNKLFKKVEVFFGNDSTVVKYKYNIGNIIFQAKSFNKEGVSDGIVNFVYNNYINCIEATGVDFQVKWQFDNNCKLKNVTRVSVIGGDENKGFDKTFEKLELNSLGDITSFERFNINNLKKNNFEYVDDINLIGDYEEFESVNYEYVYDNNKNWIQKRKENIIYKRKINYY